jgi:hypothetical protein
MNLCVVPGENEIIHQVKKHNAKIDWLSTFTVQYNMYLVRYFRPRAHHRKISRPHLSGKAGFVDVKGG